MHKFEIKVKETISDHGLLRDSGPVLVAVSGGADSVALLSALTALGYECVAAHCNFHLRGEESNRDMRHVEQITERLGVDLYVKDFDVAARRALTGESLEMACRELRYKWFFDLLDRDRAQAIAVGHHREDQAETFMLNLMRGSGLAGLAGMRHRNEHVVRPLLDLGRADIESYLSDKGLDWIVDSSNASDDFARNRLRNRVLPLMEELFPGAVDAMLRSMKNLRENCDFYQSQTKKVIDGYTDSISDEINLSELLAGEPMAPLLLFEKLRAEGFSRTQTDDMLASATRSGGTFTAGSHTRSVDHGMLRAPHAGIGEEVADNTDEYEVNLLRDIFEPLRIQVTHHHISEFSPTRDAKTAYIDAAALQDGHRWTLRRWRRGDRMTPYGMDGSKLLSDIFAANRLSAEAKRNTWVLACDGTIVWAVGLRASSSFTLGPHTKQYVKLTLCQ